LQDIENNLPIEPRYRNPKLAALAPITVVNEIYAGGDGNRGVQTAAFNLPNDERVIREKGAKRVMLKNVQDAKFEKTLVPISKIVSGASRRPKLALEAFFTPILVHELMPGPGPQNNPAGGPPKAVPQAAKETYRPAEEGQAELPAAFAIQHMIDKGSLPK